MIKDIEFVFTAITSGDLTKEEFEAWFIDSHNVVNTTMYDAGYTKGCIEGYDDGYAEGNDEGYEQGRADCDCEDEYDK